MGIFEGMERKASVGIAKDRLRTLIVSDRIDCNPNVGELFQKDLFATISKYIDTTPETFDVSISRSRITITLTGEKL
ncbi:MULTISPECIES: cell division topological specificity factor MinE [Sellimonas]|uniref:Cell division topological specificity factor MinE n=2 Tax=Lachnospiraceae TaxID=186803 RepID=A0A9D2IJM8_9FIRM|nr:MULTISPECIES: cell division topological specificity factor MinE [Sellimonas]MBY0759467.1 cell division topological specificity factor MinE [Sellimonas caecigallum]OUP02168.1 cell division topological specificity factor MinE [Drancourtella sp. An210]OUP64575.1 cell division topological specificity factor MinE [Drancourtella sp. An177]HIZ13336.1 cell division topological specificity factor MinE [Candidatus Mediterraneibacter stercorigallinarum]